LHDSKILSVKRLQVNWIQIAWLLYNACGILHRQLLYLHNSVSFQPLLKNGKQGFETMLSMCLSVSLTTSEPFGWISSDLERRWCRLNGPRCYNFSLLYKRGNSLMRWPCCLSVYPPSSLELLGRYQWYLVGR
jgi:hypothetical protein